MKNKAIDKNIILILLSIQAGFILFIFGLFTFSTYLNKKEMAEGITSQVESHLKSGPSRDTIEALSAAQIQSFSIIGYFDKRNQNVFTFPTSIKSSYFSKRSFLDKILNGAIEVEIFFDAEKETLAGTIHYIYPRFALIPFAFLFWLVTLFISSILLKHYRKVWLSSQKNVIISKVVNQFHHDLRSPIQTLIAIVDSFEDMPTQYKKPLCSSIDRIKGITKDLKVYLKKERGEDQSKSIPILHFYSSLKQLLKKRRWLIKKRTLK